MRLGFKMVRKVSKRVVVVLSANNQLVAGMLIPVWAVML